VSNGAKGGSSDSETSQKNGKESKESKEVKTKAGSGSRSPQREEPKQKIAVEMSPLEQEMYALMGLSPLVRLDEEVDRRKTLVYAVAPGEKTPDTNGQEGSIETKTPIHEDNGREENTKALEKETGDGESSTPEFAPEPEPVETETVAAASDTSEETKIAVGQEETASATSEEPPQEQKVVRRRRRRSSAKEN